MRREVQLVAAFIAAFSVYEPTKGLLRVADARTSTRAAIGLNISTYNTEYRSDYSQSVIFEENTNYEPCLCDLTQATCDAFCCCDRDCSFVSTHPHPNLCHEYPLYFREDFLKFLTH